MPADPPAPLESPGSPSATLRQVLDRFPDKVDVADVRRLVLDAGRRNDKRPAYLQVAVPDEVVKDLRGRPEKADLLLFVRIPRETLQRLESRIVLPTEL